MIEFIATTAHGIWTVLAFLVGVLPPAVTALLVVLVVVFVAAIVITRREAVASQLCSDAMRGQQPPVVQER